MYTGVSTRVVKVPKKKQCCFVALSSLPTLSQGSLSVGISVAAPAIIIPCLLLIADTAGSQQDMLWPSLYAPSPTSTYLSFSPPLSHTDAITTYVLAPMTKYLSFVVLSTDVDILTTEVHHFSIANYLLLKMVHKSSELIRHC